MKINHTLTLIAIGYSIINLLFYWHATTLNGGASMGYVFVFPFVWISTLIIVLILAAKNHKQWFQKKYVLSTIIALLFCTPVPLSLGIFAMMPPYYMVSSGSNGNDGTHYETWNYYNGGLAMTKYWKDGKKDSIWVYLNKKGDTISTETYKEDELRSKKYYK